MREKPRWPKQRLKRNRPSLRTRFELQALEPRVLLSADPMDLGNKDDAPSLHGAAAEEVVVDGIEAAGMGEKEYVIAYDPGAQVDDIFGGLDATQAAQNSEG